MERKELFFLLTVVLFCLMIIAVSIWGIFYLKIQSQECVKNPLVFGSKQISDAYGYEFQGTGFLFVPLTKKSPLFSFNSSELKIIVP